MMVIDQLNRLEDIGCLKELTKVGIIPTKYILYRAIYLKYIFLTSTGSTKMEAYTVLSDQHNISERTIMRATKVMTASI